MYSKTYMYGEELIMFYICKELGLNYVYIEDTYIIHKEGSSTKKFSIQKKKEFFSLAMQQNHHFYYYGL
ncbi:MAG: hypothetical protein MSA89_07855 [Clostridium sp.]|nr:hypothetical protein [Clostridium sp.]